MIATNGEKLEHLRVTQYSAGCVQIDFSNRWILKHNKHYNGYLLCNKSASLLARRLLQIPAVGRGLSEQLTWTPYRIKDTINAPKADGLYLVTMKYTENPKPITYILFYDTDGEYWVNSMGEDFEEDGSEVFAWRALPAPYDKTEER